MLSRRRCFTSSDRVRCSSRRLRGSPIRGAPSTAAPAAPAAAAAALLSSAECLRGRGDGRGLVGAPPSDCKCKRRVRLKNLFRKHETTTKFPGAEHHFTICTKQTARNVRPRTQRQGYVRHRSFNHVWMGRSFHLTHWKERCLRRKSLSQNTGT